MSKRAKVEPARLRHGSSSSSANNGGTNSNASGTTSASGSGSERLQGSEPPPTRRERINSIVSMAESQHSSTMPSGLAHQTTLGEIRESTQAPLMNGVSERYPRHTRQISAWRDHEGTTNGEIGSKTLPSLSDLMDDTHRGGPPPIEVNSYGSGYSTNQQRPLDSLGLTRNIPPSFQHHQSTDSNSSLSTAASFNRSGDGSLPIHTLLTGRGQVPTPPHMENSSSSSISAISSPADLGKPQVLPQPHAPRGYGKDQVNPLPQTTY